MKKKYKVIGTDRRSARSNTWRLRRLGIENKVIYEEMEMGEIYEIERLFKKYKFDEVYNLAAQSFVQTSFSSPLNTSNITGLGVLRILEAIRNYNPKARFYQASSSEMFGEVFGKKQNENTYTCSIRNDKQKIKTSSFLKFSPLPIISCIFFSITIKSSELKGFSLAKS